MKRPEIGIVVKKRFFGKGGIEVEISLPNPETHKKFIKAMLNIRR